VLPYIKRSENLQQGGSDQFHGRQGELKLSWIDDLHSSSTRFLEAAQFQGLTFNHDINDGDQDGVGYLLGTIHKGRRQSTAKAFLHPIKHRTNLTLVSRTLVRKVLIKNGQAVGVETEDAQGNIVEYRCRKEVILSAGALASPAILQHSGVGDLEHLTSIGIEPRVHSAEVGKNLQDHLFAHLKFQMKNKSGSRNGLLRSTSGMGLETFKWLFTGKGALNTTSAQIVGFFKSSDRQARADLQLAMRPLSFSVKDSGEVVVDNFAGITVSAIQTRPHSSGQVRIASADPRRPAQIDSNYLSDPRDIEALRLGMREIRRIVQHPSMAELIEQELEPGIDQSTDEAIETYLRNSAATVYHPAGTCRMGSDTEAVTDPRLRVNGVRNLRVADASIMPVITSGNTNAPAIMIGEKASDLILSDHMD
jgi:choline dehydrogenase